MVFYQKFNNVLIFTFESQTHKGNMLIRDKVDEINFITIN